MRGCEGEALDERTRRRIVDDVDRDACRAQTSGTAARDRVGIERAGDDARDAGSEDRLRARPGPAVMVAWLERDVQGCAANVGTAGARGKQGFDFRVRLAAAMVIALAQRSAITDDDRTDRRIRRCVGDRTRREFIRSREISSFELYGLTSTPFQNAIWPAIFFAAGLGSG